VTNAECISVLERLEIFLFCPGSSSIVRVKWRRLDRFKGDAWCLLDVQDEVSDFSHIPERKREVQSIFSLLIKTISHKMTKQPSHFSPDTSDNTMRSPLYLFSLLSIWIIVTVGKLQQAWRKMQKRKACGAWNNLT